MNHYEVSFVDRTVELVGIENPVVFIGSTKDQWWHVTLLSLDAETKTKLVPCGKAQINLNNVTFIKEV
jgi:hypothetical protein